MELGKRMTLESNENNYKLEIVRLRLRCEEVEKCLRDKITKVKELQA